MSRDAWITVTGLFLYGMAVLGTWLVSRLLPDNPWVTLALGSVFLLAAFHLDQHVMRQVFAEEDADV